MTHYLRTINNIFRIMLQIYNFIIKIIYKRKKPNVNMYYLTFVIRVRSDTNMIPQYFRHKKSPCVTAPA
jgi:hypothetical protein